MDNTFSSWFESSLTDSFTKTKAGKTTYLPPMTEFEQDEIQDMIDRSIAKAMRKHERDVAVISGFLGLLGLAFYTHGVVRLVDILVS